MAAQISEPIIRLGLQLSAEKGRLSVKVPGLIKTAPPIIMDNGQDGIISKSIWVDPQLDAVDVRSWGVMKTQMMPGAAISLNQLLKDQLHYSKATVSKVIYVLRLTRWISLCQKPGINDACQPGNRYVVHDSPCAINDAICIDPDYLVFVKKQLAHSNKQVRDIAESVWKNVQETVVHTEQLLTQNSSAPDSCFIDRLNLNVRPVQYFKQDKKVAVQMVNLRDGEPVQKMNSAIPCNEIIGKQLLAEQVQKLNLGGTVCSSLLSINNKTTTNVIKVEKETEVKIALIFPNEFHATEIKMAELYLQRVEPELQQAFLDEMAAKIDTKRKTSNPVRNPIGYLAWLCNSHAKGLAVLTSLSVRYAEKRELARKKSIEKQAVKSKERINSAGQEADKRSCAQSAEVYKSRMIDLRASLNLSKNNKVDGCTRSMHS